MANIRISQGGSHDFWFLSLCLCVFLSFCLLSFCNMGSECRGVAKRFQPRRLPWLLIDAPPRWPPPLNGAPTNHVSITLEKNLARTVSRAARIIRPLLQFASFFSLSGGGSFILHFYHLVGLARPQKGSSHLHQCRKKLQLKIFCRFGWCCLGLSIERTSLNTPLTILESELQTFNCILKFK